jgi:putative hydrolase of the HAD superfamily
MVPSSERESPLDFSYVENWVFDLDNTLYPASSALFAQVDERIRDYVCRYLGLAPEAAYRLQKEYFHAHGTTLNGLMKVHGMAPQDYLDYVHDIDITAIAPDPVLYAALSRLSGRKYIFTNGTVAHAERIMRRLGVHECFDGILDIVALDYQPKPRVQAYERLQAHTNLVPSRSVMFEDVARNLAPAHAMGMTTVWVRRFDDIDRSHEGAGEDFIHHVTDNLAEFLGRLA